MKRLLLHGALILLALILTVWLTFTVLKVYTDHGQSIPVPDLVGMKISKVEKTLKQKKLRYTVFDTTDVQDKSVPPLSVMEQDPKPGEKVKEGRRVYITLNNPNEPISTVPSISNNASLRAVKNAISKARLKVGDIAYVPHKFKDLVLEMKLDGKTLRAGEKVPSMSEIDLVVGKGRASSMVRVPNLVGMTLENAQLTLDASNLLLGNVIPSADVVDVQQAEVYLQVPDPGPYGDKSILAGQQIDVYLRPPSNDVGDKY